MNLSLYTDVIFLLLGLGYLFTLILIIAYERKHTNNLVANTFFLAKCTQTIAWFCLIFRGSNLDFLSVSFANSLLFVSYSLEVIALLSLKQPLPKKTKKNYLAFTVLAIIGFQLIVFFYNIEYIRIAYYSLITAAIYFSVYRIVFGKSLTILMRITGSLYLLIATASLIRGLISITSATLSTSLFTPGTYQIITLLTIYIFTNLGSIGFILLIKEKVDQELIYFASYDDLTGTLNRRTFTERANQYLFDHAKKGQPLSYILFDVDNFKEINDTFGHHIGDKVLQELTLIIKQHLEKDDLFGRYGGDEFGIILARKNVEESTKIAEEIKQSLNANINSQFPVTYTISMGIITIIPEHFTNLEMLYTNCDQALYIAKKNGRNGISRGHIAEHLEFSYPI